MPNGGDKNYIRLCAAIEGFRVNYNAWPTAVRVRADMIADLRDHVLGPEAFAKVEAKLRIIPEDGAFMIAEDGTGRTYDYGEKGFPDQEPDIRAGNWLGVGPLEWVGIDKSMEAALTVTASPNYLGNPTVIDSVLIELWKTVFNRSSAGAMDADEAVKADSETCKNAARIFLGLDPNYTAMPAWNRPGVIDNHVAEVLNIAERDPVTRIAFLLMSYLSELWGVVAAMKKSGVGGDQFQQQEGGAVLQKYRNMLMGLIEPTPNRGDLKPDASSSAEEEEEED
jgi:hypothetical protein